MSSHDGALPYREPTPEPYLYDQVVPQDLSDRERDVVALVATGLTNVEIGERLFVSVNTVKTYIRTAYRKIGVTSRSQAVLWALQHDLHEIPGVRVVRDADLQPTPD